MRASVKTFILALLAGIVYTLAVNPNATFVFGLHIYLLLALVSAATAFVAKISMKIDTEKVILLTLAGVIIATVSPTVFNFALISDSVFDVIVRESFITLFFAGHASLIGAFAALAVKNVNMKKRPQKFSRNTRNNPYYRYSVTD